MTRILGLFLVLILFVDLSLAQDVPIKVRPVDQGPGEFSALNDEVGAALRSEVTGHGLRSEGQGIDLFYSAQEVTLSNEGLVALSLVEGHELGEAVVEAGAKHQIYYAGQPQPEDAEEARFAREYMTRDILSNNVQVVNITQLVFPRDQMSAIISDYFDDFFKRVFCAHSDELCR